jgi:hypothetical protein
MNYEPINKLKVRLSMIMHGKNKVDQMLEVFILYCDRRRAEPMKIDSESQTSRVFQLSNNEILFIMPEKNGKNYQPKQVKRKNHQLNQIQKVAIDYVIPSIRLPDTLKKRGDIMLVGRALVSFKANMPPRSGRYIA